MSNSQRLTREIRDSIITKAVARLTKPRHAAFEAKLPSFADRLYEHAYGEHAPIARAVPHGWISWTETIILKAEGWTSRWYKENDDRGQYRYTPVATIRLSQEQPAPLAMSFEIHKGGGKDNAAAHPFYAEAQALAREYAAIIEAEEELSQDLRAFMAPHHTVKQLLAAWPEGSQFLPPQAPKTYAVAPVGLLDKVNTLLGLKTVNTDSRAVISKAMRRKASTKGTS